jgi:GTP cyclohydrolase I
MKDPQSLADLRNVPLERVGITRLALPVSIKRKGGGYQHVAVEAGLFVEVPATVRGTHLSRFVELLNEWIDSPVSSVDIKSLLAEARRRLGSYSAEAALSFKYFIEKQAPVSGRKGVLDYGCQFWGRLDSESYDFRLAVSVPVTTLCPCSKEISEYGAHNQRAFVKALVRYEEDAFLWLEDLIALIERQASSPLYPVLKREDERDVTEGAYRNPKFVEDVVRDIVLELREHPGVTWFSVECESLESIHNHNAFAAVEHLVIPTKGEPRTRADASLSVPTGGDLFG